MKIRFPREKLNELITRFDTCEWISDNECVIDLYDTDPAVTLDIVCKGKSTFVDGASVLRFDEENDGWYMAENIEDASLVERVLSDAFSLPDKV